MSALTGVRLLSLALDVPGPVAVARLVANGSLEPHFRTRRYHWLSLPIDAPLEDVMASGTSAEWAAVGRLHGVPISLVSTGR